MKTCSCCERRLPRGAFSRMEAAPDGLQYNCRRCIDFRHALRRWAKRTGENPTEVDRCAREACAVQQWDDFDRECPSRMDYAPTFPPVMSGAVESWRAV